MVAEEEWEFFWHDWHGFKCLANTGEHSTEILYFILDKVSTNCTALKIKNRFGFLPLDSPVCIGNKVNNYIFCKFISFDLVLLISFITYHLPVISALAFVLLDAWRCSALSSSSTITGFSDLFLRQFRQSFLLVRFAKSIKSEVHYKKITRDMQFKHNKYLNDVTLVL